MTFKEYFDNFPDWLIYGLGVCIGLVVIAVVFVALGKLLLWLIDVAEWVLSGFKSWPSD